MTMRQWYKGQALAGWAAGRNRPMDGFESSVLERVAESCGKYADAMLAEDAAFAEREKGTK